MFVDFFESPTSSQVCSLHYRSVLKKSIVHYSLLFRKVNESTDSSQGERLPMLYDLARVHTFIHIMDREK